MESWTRHNDKARKCVLGIEVEVGHGSRPDIGHGFDTADDRRACQEGYDKDSEFNGTSTVSMNPQQKT